MSRTAPPTVSPRNISSRGKIFTFIDTPRDEPQCKFTLVRACSGSGRSSIPATTSGPPGLRCGWNRSSVGASSDACTAQGRPNHAPDPILGRVEQPRHWTTYRAAA
jgi:hypothetical protein